MKAPDKIYLNIPKQELEAPLDSTTLDTKEFDGCINIEYIRKDALLDWAKEQLAYYQKLEEEGDPVRWGQRNAFQQVIDKFKSL